MTGPGGAIEKHDANETGRGSSERWGDLAGWMGSRIPAVVDLPILAACGSVLVAAAIAFWGLIDFASMRQSVEPTITGTERLFFVPSDSSPEIILPAFVWMLWNRRGALKLSLVNPGTAWIGVPVLLAAGAVIVWSHYVSQPPLLLFGLAGVLMGGGWLLGGRRAVRALLVPTLFLQLAWPLPGVLVNHVVYPLQLMAGDISTALLSLLGIPWQRAGDLVFTGGTIFQVIETCSGLRGFATLLMTAFVYNELVGHGDRRLFWLALFSLPLAFVLNGLRVLTIILNPYSEIAAVHSTQGIIVIVAGVVCLALFDSLIDRIPSKGLFGQDIPRSPPVSEGSIPVLRWRWAGVVVALLSVAGMTSFVQPWQPETEVRVRLKQRVPTELAGWTGTTTPIDEQFLGTVRYSDSLSRVYRRGDDAVSVLVLEDNRIHPLLSLDSPKTAVAFAGWDRVERRGVHLESVEEASVLALRSARGDEQLVLHWRDGLESLPVELIRSAFSLDRSPLRRSQPARSVRIAMPIDHATGGREQTESRLMAFAKDLIPALEPRE